MFFFRSLFAFGVFCFGLACALFVFACGSFFVVGLLEVLLWRSQ